MSLLEEEHKEGNITLDNVKAILLDILTQGVLTTTSAIHLAFLAMTQYPEVQKKVQQEIHSVVESDRLPSLDVNPNLPCCQATLLEIFRYFTNVPLPGPRTATTECTYRGYIFPKDTVITYNVWHMNHNDDFWVNPYKIDPTRFLDSDGILVPPEDERRQRLMTFGAGKRSCVGESLEGVRIFLALTAVLQNFDLQEDPVCPYHVQFLTMAPPYQLRFFAHEEQISVGLSSSYSERQLNL